MSVATIEAPPETAKRRRRRRVDEDEGTLAPEASLDTEEDAAMDGITELEKIAPERVDGVTTPANGFPVLMMKSTAPPAAKGDPDDDDSDSDPDGTEDMGSDADDADDDDTAKGKSGKKPRKPAKGKGGKKPRKPAKGKPSTGADAEDISGSGDSHGTGDDDVIHDQETIKGLADADREAYEAERAGWLAREPVSKEAAGGTEWLQTRAAWQKWHAEGEEKGLDGTPAGVAKWAAARGVTKRDFDPDVGGGVDRDKIPAEDFVDPKRRRFPIVTAEDVSDAVHSYGRAKPKIPFKTFKRRVEEIARRKGFESALPEEWKKEDKKARKAQAVSTIEKALAAGIITQETASDLRGELAAKGKKKRNKRDLPKSVKPAGKHREPDGTSTVERLEPQAGLPTDPDKKKDKVPASVAAEYTKSQYATKRMHDALCPAYAEKDVLQAYPSLAKVTDAINVDVVKAAKVGKAKLRKRLVKAAEALRHTDPALVSDARSALKRAYTEEYPTERISPAKPPKPSQFHRSYLNSGHAAESAGDWTVNTPPDPHTVDADDFDRGYLSAGHAAPSPADHSPGNPAGSRTGSSRETYSFVSREVTEQALRSIHDHIAATNANLCPMAPSRTVMPPELEAGATPVSVQPMDMGGVRTVKTAKKAKKDMVVSKKELKKKLAKARKQGEKKARKALHAKLLADGRVLENMVAEKTAAVAGRYETQLAELQSIVDKLGSQPDPVMAPVRGQMARAGGNAAPVEKRSLVDEVAEKQRAEAIAERQRYIDYVRKMATSTNPETQERAEAVLRKFEQENATQVPA